MLPHSSANLRLDITVLPTTNSCYNTPHSEHASQSPRNSRYATSKLQRHQAPLGPTAASPRLGKRDPCSLERSQSPPCETRRTTPPSTKWCSKRDQKEWLKMEDFLLRITKRLSSQSHCINSIQQ